ncbi:MAG TPA: hypothetical protein VFG30_21060 [Polyangiales bacterium]|nr:hypothetical protein [Polyangiales bacterium]
MHSVRARLTRTDLNLLAFGAGALVLGGLVYTTRRVMWIDEVLAFTIVSQSSWSDLWTQAQDVIGSVPLYYLLGHAWGLVFGFSEFSIRIMTMAFMVSSMLLLWLKLRQYYSAFGTAIGVLSGFCLSNLVLYQNIEIRFYGVHTFFGVVMLWVYDWVAQPAPSGSGWRTWIAKYAALAATTYAWVMLHLYGLIFSAVALGALVIADLLQQKFRPLLYTSVPVAFGAFYASWHTQLHQQSAVLRLHGWFMPKPAILDMFLMAGAYIHPVYLALLLMVGVAALLELSSQGRLANLRLTAASETPEEQLGRGRLVVFGLLFSTVPILVWVLCQVISPAYIPRYMIPVVIGYSVLFTHLAERTVVSKLSAEQGALLSAPLRRGLMIAYVAVLLIVPVGQSIVNKKTPTPGYDDASVGHADLPVVYEHAHDFVPRAFYAGRGNRFHYVLDLEIAVDKLNTGHAANDYVILENLAKYHSDLYHVEQVREFLRDHAEFLVFHRTDNPGYRWLELRLMNRPDYAVKQIGEVDSCAVYHVKRTGNEASMDELHVHAAPLPALTH